MERQQIGRGQVAGGVVEEHVFGAGVAGADVARRLAGVPVVHGGVEVQAGIGRGPGGVADLLPEVARLQRLHDLAVLAGDQVPGAVGLDGAQEIVLQRDGVVGVLAGDGEVRLRIPVGVVDREVDLLVALLGVLDDALDDVVVHQRAAGELDLAAQRRVLLGIEAIVVAAFAVHAGLQDRLEVLVVGLGAGDQRRDLLLFLHLPVDIGFDIRMVGVDHHHLGGAARGAARLDRARGAVADLQEAHQAGRASAARELLAFAAQAGEVGAGAGAILEQTGFANPEVHDAAFIDQIVLDALDEAGMRLRVLVGRFRLGQLAGLPVDVIMALAGTVDAVSPVQAGVEPLRRIRRDHLLGEHVAQLVVEGVRVFLGGEVGTLPAPIGPAAGEAVEHLLGRQLGDEALFLGQGGQRLGVGHRAPQPRRHGLFFDLLQTGGDAGLAEIFLRQHVGGDLRPGIGDFDILQLEHHGAVRIADLGGRVTEVDPGIGRLVSCGVAAIDLHWSCPVCADKPPGLRRRLHFCRDPQGDRMLISEHALAGVPATRKCRGHAQRVTVPPEPLFGSS